MRMGTDKALVPVAGIPMVEWIATEPLAGIPAIPDLRARPRGPLAGLVTALHHAAGRSVLLVAVDQPLVQHATLQGLVDLLDRVAVVPMDDGARQTTCAAYPGAWAAEADQEDRSGGSIQSLLDRLPYREVGPQEWSSWGEDGRSWHSVDTPEAAAAVLDRYPADPETERPEAE